MKKNICFNILGISGKGGMERMCSSLANSLADEGYDVHIVSLYEDKDLIPFFPISNKVSCYNLLPNVNEKRICIYFKQLGYAEWKYKRYLKNNRIDVVIDVGTTITPFTTPIARKMGIKHIAWDHFCYQCFIERPAYKQILPCLTNAVDKLVLLTDKDCLNYINQSNIPADKVVRIYNFSSIEEDHFIPHESKRVLAVGRLRSEKGFDLLLQSWAIVEKKNNDWELEIVGEGDAHQSLLEQIDQLSLKRVTISPATPDPRSKYEKASIYVLPSRFEGLGLVLIEAANMSLPIVSFSCDNGPKELLEDGITGFLVPVGDTEGMADKILTLMSNPSLRSRMGLNAFKSMEKVRKEVIVKQWIELIETL